MTQKINPWTPIAKDSPTSGQLVLGTNGGGFYLVVFHPTWIPKKETL